MIRLFQRAQKILIFGILATSAVTAMMLMAGEYAFAIFTVIAGLWVSWLACMYSAIGAHQKLLSILYDKMQPSAFMDAYGPIIKKVQKGSAMEAAMRAHMGNALAAMGDYREALPWYESACARADVRLMQAENRCRCYLALNDMPRLKNEEAEWDKCLGEVKPARRAASQKARQVLKIRCRLNEGTADTSDQIAIQEEKQNTNKRLHRVEMSLLLAKIYRLLGFHYAAVQELTALTALNPELECSREARILLEELADEEQGTEGSVP